jgi:UDP-galactopyranose mutase
MNIQEVTVIGAGISGLAFAWKAARAGRRVLLLERRERAGGCFYSRRTDDGFWYETGAHTVYNSYSSLLDIAAEAGITDRLVQRGPARVHFGLLRDGNIAWLNPPKILRKINWFEAARHAPFGFLSGKKGRSVRQYYSGLLGPGNFHRLLAPFFAAVPSQPADDFPVKGPGSLFKIRPRRKQFPRSFGFTGGLETLCDAIVAHPNIELRTGVNIAELLADGDVWRIRLQDGEELSTLLIAVAVPPDSAAVLVKNIHPELAAILRRIRTVRVESFGARVDRDKCALPECAFIVPADDIFYSAVTRDPFPDSSSRGFAFHFRTGIIRERKIRCVCQILGVLPEDLGDIAENEVTLPSPRVNHAALTADIRKLLDRRDFALTGNYFGGLAIEDCIARSFDEWRRVQLRQPPKTSES